MPDAPHQIYPKTLRVSELTRYLKYLVEQDEFLGAVSVRGEIANFSRAPSGHTYFSLKDASSQVACVLFREKAAQQVNELQGLCSGLDAEVHGFVTVYEPRGTFQLYVERVISEGAGSFARRFDLLKAKLETEGLFAVERKRPLPAFPRKLALVTSPGSQAYHDVLQRLRSQYPFITLIEVPVTVQGEHAAAEMTLAIEMVNRLTDAEVILLVRGGGAPEELAAFNDEDLARAVFASRIPVVTGVGHEMDHTVVDFVADRRASTPSLAAAASVPDSQALLSRTGHLHAQLTQAVRQHLGLARRRWQQTNIALARTAPANRLRQNRQRTDEQMRNAQRLMEAHVQSKRAKLVAVRGQLGALDPLSILTRGYAVLVQAQSGRVVSSVEHAIPGQVLVARVSDGQFKVRVEKP